MDCIFLNNFFCYVVNDVEKLFQRNAGPTKGVSLIPSRDIVRGSHHCKSQTHREQDLNLHMN